MALEGKTERGNSVAATNLGEQPSNVLILCAEKTRSMQHLSAGR
jgi:hypothetical protein